MRLCRFALSVFAVFFLTFVLVSCGGTASVLSKQAPSISGAVPNSPSGGGSTGGGSTGGGSTGGGSTGGGSTPSSGTVIDNIEDNNWLTCGACGNNGGTGAVAGYSATTGIGSPSEDGSSVEFRISATVPFTNAYFYQQHNPVPTHFAQLTYEFDLYIPSGLENLPQAIEFECQQQLSGWIYNFAWQADYASNSWRIFDYGAKRWDSTGISLQRFSPGTWHHIVTEYHNDTTTHSVFHDAIAIDGVRTPVNIRHNAFFSGSGDQFTNAFQLDSNNIPSPYRVYVDKMKITYQ